MTLDFLWDDPQALKSCKAWSIASAYHLFGELTINPAIVFDHAWSAREAASCKPLYWPIKQHPRVICHVRDLTLFARSSAPSTFVYLAIPLIGDVVATFPYLNNIHIRLHMTSISTTLPTFLSSLPLVVPPISTLMTLVIDFGSSVMENVPLSDLLGFWTHISCLKLHSSSIWATHSSPFTLSRQCLSDSDTGTQSSVLPCVDTISICSFQNVTLLSLLLDALPGLMDTSTLCALEFHDYLPNTSLTNAVNQFLRTNGSGIKSFSVSLSYDAEEYYDDCVQWLDEELERTFSLASLLINYSYGPITSHQNT